VGSAGTIRNSYTMGFVDKATAGVGGFVGRNEGVIETSFSIGAIPNAGNGFLGENVALGAPNFNFYDQTTSGKNDTTGATPLPTTPEMQTLNTFFSIGWDISTGTGTIWGIVDGTSYPYLNWQPPGTGTRP
jgi:hypothetical protein